MEISNGRQCGQVPQGGRLPGGRLSGDRIPGGRLRAQPHGSPPAVTGAFGRRRMIAQRWPNGGRPPGLLARLGRTARHWPQPPNIQPLRSAKNTIHLTH